MISKNWIRLRSFDDWSVLRNIPHVPKTLNTVINEDSGNLICDVSSLGQQP